MSYQIFPPPTEKGSNLYTTDRSFIEKIRVMVMNPLKMIEIDRIPVLEAKIKAVIHGIMNKFSREIDWITD